LRGNDRAATSRVPTSALHGISTRLVIWPLLSRGIHGRSSMRTSTAAIGVAIREGQRDGETIWTFPRDPWWCAPGPKSRAGFAWTFWTFNWGMPLPVRRGSRYVALHAES